MMRHMTEIPYPPDKGYEPSVSGLFRGFGKTVSRSAQPRPAFTGEIPIVSKGLHGANEADRLSARLITWRRTAGLGIFAIALMIATPSLEDA
jgi:hypothetical protein